MTDASQSAIFRSFPHPAPAGAQGPGSPQPISPVLTLSSASSACTGNGTARDEMPAATTARAHRCRVCSARFGSARMRAMHERVAHERGALWRCVHCAALHGSARQLSDHILACHRGGAGANSGQELRCTRCTAVFTSPALMGRHIAAHSAAEAAVARARRRHPCAHCSYVADSPGALRFHAADRHPVEAGLLPRTLSTTVLPRAAELRRQRMRPRPADALFMPDRTLLVGDKENAETCIVVPQSKVLPQQPLAGAGGVLQSRNVV